MLLDSDGKYGHLHLSVLVQNNSVYVAAVQCFITLQYKFQIKFLIVLVLFWILKMKWSLLHVLLILCIILHKQLKSKVYMQLAEYAKC